MFVRFVPLHGAEFKHAKLQVDPTDKLTVIREKVAKHFNIDHFKLLFLGRQIIDNDQPMSYYKMNSNSTIHVIESGMQGAMAADEISEKKPAPSDDEIQQFLIAFGMAVRNPCFHKVAQRLAQRENLETSVATCPDLAKDPVACAFLSKPELLYSLLDQETLKYVHEKHPGLWEVAYQLAAAVHEERPTKSSATAEEGEIPNPFAYNLDEMSDEDDEDEDMETGAPAGGQARGARRSIGEGITADQLASALANARSTLGMAAANPGPSGSMGGMTGFTIRQPSSSAAASESSRPSASGITQNQLAEALRLACGGAFGATPGSNTPATPAPPPNYDSQLATMRELGIVDERLATRALQIMGGDVQAAIDLIYSGWSGEDDSAN